MSDSNSTTICVIGSAISACRPPRCSPRSGISSASASTSTHGRGRHDQSRRDPHRRARPRQLGRAARSATACCGPRRAGAGGCLHHRRADAVPRRAQARSHLRRGGGALDRAGAADGQSGDPRIDLAGRHDRSRSRRSLALRPDLAFPMPDARECRRPRRLLPGARAARPGPASNWSKTTASSAA